MNEKLIFIRVIVTIVEFVNILNLNKGNPKEGWGREDRD